jgi:sterol desaturase/sphingolipid hydroxylase (fatty acid hydroxylase superfamily)
MIIIEFLLFFILWNFMIYCNHRLAHILPFYYLHDEHHRLVKTNSESGPNWKNYFLYLDNLKVTLDNWIIEVIPTLIFSYITGYWIFSVFHYIWTAFLQEHLEHNPKLNLYPFTFGKWHMMHHSNYNCNYGLLIPIWDRIFGTEIR